MVGDPLEDAAQIRFRIDWRLLSESLTKEN
jgi:hypothetical protein